MFLWIVITGGFFSFFASMGIGANDAANAFATSVGSKTLTIRQAVILAAIFETSGAILMGNHVTNTIRKGIADHQCFEDNPEVLMYGCMWVIFSVGVWLFLASYLEMPVSTTHSCVGGMIGMALVLGGVDCVIWYKPLETFPYVGGVSGIVMSWFISPVFACLMAMFTFSITRTFALRHNFNTKRINIVYPVLIGSTMTINIFFIIYKGAKGLGLDKTSLEVAFAVAFGTGGVCALITIPLVPRFKKAVHKKFANKKEKTCEVEMKCIENRIIESRNTLNIRNDVELNRVVALHQNAEKFDEKTEDVFKYLQVFTAVCGAFSHGANDVANAIGPFAAIFMIYNSGDKLKKENSLGDDAYWILGMGGLGIAIGLFVYGYKIMHAIGDKLCKITPSRGVAIELSSALVIIVGSRLKMPLSTTHCQIGATIGVGLLEDATTCSGINCKVVLKTIVGWLITCVVVGGTTALLVSQGAYAPSVCGWETCLIKNATQF